MYNNNCNKLSDKRSKKYEFRINDLHGNRQQG